MAEFMLVAMDQVVNEAPRFRYMSGGQVKVPLVLKAGYGFTAGWAGQHTGSIYGDVPRHPGLEGRAARRPRADAKGLMATRSATTTRSASSIHYLLTLEPARSPTASTWSRSARPTVRRAGGDVTIVATGWMVGKALAAAETLAAEGIDAEVIDPRTLAAARHGDDPDLGREDRPGGARRPGDPSTRPPRR